MYSKIKIFGHPLHPILVGFPVAFYAAALACFIAYNSNHDPFWFKVGYVANCAGICMAALAALPGFIDWLFIPASSKAKKTGTFHMLCNVAALGIYSANMWRIKDQWTAAVPDMGPAIQFTAAGFGLTLVAGFLGWTMVQKHHVGVDMSPGNTP